MPEVGCAKKSKRCTHCLVDTFKFSLAIEPVCEPKSPAFDRASCQRSLKIRMSRSMTSVAQCDQVAGIVEAAGCAGDEMVNVEFTYRERDAAGDAGVVVAGEDNFADFAPGLDSLAGRRMHLSILLQIC
jgi:hypothetical protein